MKGQTPKADQSMCSISSHPFRSCNSTPTAPCVKISKPFGHISEIIPRMATGFQVCLVVLAASMNAGTSSVFDSQSPHKRNSDILSGYISADRTVTRERNSRSQAVPDGYSARLCIVGDNADLRNATLYRSESALHPY